MKWLQRTDFKRSKIHLVMRSQKQAFAKDTDGEPNVLIDDYIKNIKEWEAKRVVLEYITHQFPKL